MSMAIVLIVKNFCQKKSVNHLLVTNRYHLLLPCQIVSTFLIKNREHTFCIHVVSDQSILVRDESIVAYLNVYAFIQAF